MKAEEMKVNIDLSECLAFFTVSLLIEGRQWPTNYAGFYPSDKKLSEVFRLELPMEPEGKWVALVTKQSVKFSETGELTAGSFLEKDIVLPNSSQAEDERIVEVDENDLEPISGDEEFYWGQEVWPEDF